MPLFVSKRKESEISTLPGWERLNPEELQARSIGLLSAVLALLDALKGQTVSPGSRESSDFSNRLDEIGRRLVNRPATRAELASMREDIASSAVRHGEWQRKSVFDLQYEIAGGTQELLGLIRSAAEQHAERTRFLVEYRTAIAATPGIPPAALTTLDGEIARSQATAEQLRREYAAAQEFVDRRLKRLENASSRDFASGLPNRASFDSVLSSACRDVGVMRRPYCLALIGVQSEGGLGAADAVARHVATHRPNLLPAHYVLARTGTDEFAVLLPLNPEEATNQIQHALRQLQAHPIVGTEGQAVTAHFSAGLAALQPDESPSEVWGRAAIHLMQHNRIQASA